MNKQLRNILIVLALLVLAATVYLIAKNVSDPSAVEETTAPTEAYTLPVIDQTKLTSISLTIRKSDVDTEIRSLEFTLKDDMTGWEWTEDRTVPLDNTVFAEIVTAISGKSSAYRLTDISAGSLKDYGLDSPTVEAVFGYADGSTFACKIGSYNAFSGSYYFADASEPSVVYTIPSASADMLDRTIDDFVLSETAPEIQVSGIRSVTVEKDGSKLVYTYSPSGIDGYYTDEYKWSLSVNGGEAFPVSVGFGDSLAKAVNGAAFGDCVAFRADTDLSLYGLDAPVKMTVAYTYKDKVSDSASGSSTEVTKNAEWVLLFGNADENGSLYVKTGEGQLVYTMEDSSVYASAIEADELALRPSEIIVIKPEVLDSIEFSSGGKKLGVLFEKKDTSVIFKDASGAELKYDAYSLIAKTLGEIKATSDSSLIQADSSVASDNPVFTAVLGLGDGKTAELKLMPYTSGYFIVSFLDRSTQLITADDAKTLTDAFEAYFG